MQLKHIYISQIHDPYLNLAVEERIFDTIPAGDRALLLYVNGPCVVMGKHQNPWLEVNLSAMHVTGTPLVRRISGGGTVYHDPGNLNFSFIGPRSHFDRLENLRIIQEGLSRLGIEATVTESYDLYAHGAKISGNSFCFRKEKALHHGTVLIDADMTTLRALLSPMDVSIQTHAVASRRAVTTNLKKYNPTVTVTRAQSAITESFQGEDTGCAGVMPFRGAADQAALDLESRNRTWEWIYGRTPGFDWVIPITIRLDRRRTINSAVLLKVKKGIIEEVETPSGWEALQPILGKCRMSKTDIAGRTAIATPLETHITRIIDVIYKMATWDLSP